MNAGPVKRRLMTKTQTQLTIGIDLGDRHHAVCVIDKNGQIILEETLANTRACLEGVSQRGQIVLFDIIYSITYKKIKQWPRW